MFKWFFQSLWLLIRTAFVLVAVVCIAEVGARFVVQVKGVERLSQLHSEESNLKIDCPVTVQTWEHSTEIQQTNPQTQISHSVKINSLGFRGEEILIPKPEGRVRILCLGDETVAGFSVEQAQTFCSQAQTLLQDRSMRQVEVINAGGPNYCPLLSAIQLRRSIMQVQPDLVVFLFDMSDIADDYRYRHRAIFDDQGYPVAIRNGRSKSKQPKPLDRLDDFVLGQYVKDNVMKYCQKNVLPESNSDIDSVSGQYAWLRDNAPDWSSYIRQSVQPITQMKLLCDKAGIPFVVTTCPKPWQVSMTACNGVDVRRRVGIGEATHCSSRVPFEMLRDFSASQNIEFVDTSIAFQNFEDRDSLYQNHTIELSEQGHQLMANQLTQYLLTKQSQILTSIQ